MSAVLAEHQHGKGRVRLGRTWREGDVHHFSEWAVYCMLESDMAHSFRIGSNTNMTATDTQKNTVYYIAKQCSSRCSPEDYAVALAKHFVAEYPKVTKAKIRVEATPWQRVTMDGKPHNHGFIMGGQELRTCYAEASESGKIAVRGGVKGLKVLKTTQSGYEGFLHDKYTLLKDTKERIVATSITSTWRYSGPTNYDAAYKGVIAGICEAFYGEPTKGVYSPSVQYTLFEMGKAVLARVSAVDSIFFNLPNIHFIPCPVVSSKFEDDVYIATSEPHGDIEATITRDQVQPHCKL